MLESAAICLYLAQEFSNRVDLLPNPEQFPAYFKYVRADIMLISWENELLLWAHGSEHNVGITQKQDGGSNQCTSIYTTI